jgi:hypothetical protein
MPALRSHPQPGWSEPICKKIMHILCSTLNRHNRDNR